MLGVGIKTKLPPLRLFRACDTSTRRTAKSPSTDDTDGGSSKYVVTYIAVLSKNISSQQRLALRCATAGYRVFRVLRGRGRRGQDTTGMLS